MAKLVKRADFVPVDEDLQSRLDTKERLRDIINSLVMLSHSVDYHIERNDWPSLDKSDQQQIERALVLLVRANSGMIEDDDC